MDETKRPEREIGLCLIYGKENTGNLKDERSGILREESDEE